MTNSGSASFKVLVSLQVPSPEAEYLSSTIVIKSQILKVLVVHPFLKICTGV